MKQLLILSGKGGTGKTTVASAFIKLSNCKSFADCDVDAPNLHLVMSENMEPVINDFYGFQKAYIDSSKCISCGLCEENCHFGAIKDFEVSLYECEGCGVCCEICPQNAVSMTEYASGSLKLYKSQNKVFSTAKLKMGSGASGKLVTAVKKQLLKESHDSELVIIDGSPGIGCPVIASISGANLVLIVTEPTVSGIHDMKRIIKTAKQFGTACIVCINKFDVEMDNTKKIEAYCNEIQIPVVGRIPFDNTVIKAVNNFKSIAEYQDSKAAKAIKTIWNIIYEKYLLSK